MNTINLTIKPQSFASAPQSLENTAAKRPLIQFGAKETAAQKRVRTVKEVLQRMPARDKKALVELFSEWFKDDVAGYVLEGVKPAFISATAADQGGVLASPKNSREERNWLVWEKYRAQLPHPNFIIRREANKFRREPNLQEIVFINKRAALAKIKESPDHLLAFQTVAGMRLSPKVILSCLETANPISFALFNTESTEASLLGYGLAGGKLYERYTELTFHPVEGWKDDVRTDIPPSEGFTTTQEEMKALLARMNEGHRFLREQTGQNGEESICPPQPGQVHPPLPGFATVDGDQEGLTTLKKAIEVRPKLTELCQLDDDQFLEEVLTRMARPNPPGGFSTTA